MKKLPKLWLSLSIAVLMLFAAAIPAAALSDIYRIDTFGVSVKVPKGYSVIMRDTPADDPVFSVLRKGYTDTMSEMESANVYLVAYDSELIFQLRLKITRSEKINSYNDLSEAEMRELLASDSRASKVRLGEYLFIETSLEDNSGEEPLYINKCSTIANGLQLEFTLRKTGEPITQDEAKALVSLASSVEFDASQEDSSGLTFDWWRLFLWVFILVALTLVLWLAGGYRRTLRQRRIEKRRSMRDDAGTTAVTEETVSVGGDDITFDEALGYRDADRFSARVGGDIEAFDINVREKDPSLGINYFEDGGKSIDDHSEDYFEAYFKEPTPARSGIARLFATIGAYIGIAFRHVGYFFRNLFSSFRRKKS